jgi:hypothetical protein
MNEPTLTLSKENVKSVAINPDAIIVIGAGLKVNNQEIVIPSAQTESNLKKAVEIHMDYTHHDTPLVLSGGFSIFKIPSGQNVIFRAPTLVEQVINFDKSKKFTDYDQTITEAEAMDDWLTQHQYKDMFPITFLEVQSRCSYENIRYCLDRSEKEGWKRVVIIDQPMRLLRLKLLVNSEIKKRKLSIGITFVPSEPIFGKNTNIQSQWDNPFKLWLYELGAIVFNVVKRKIII